MCLPPPCPLLAAPCGSRSRHAAPARPTRRFHVCIPPHFLGHGERPPVAIPTPLTPSGARGMLDGRVRVRVLAADLRAAEPTFEKDVRPVLKAYCLDCHGGGEKLASNLDLRLKRFALKGGDGGPAIVPGQGSASAIVERMRSGEMPPGEKKVPPELIDVVSRWIDAGAVVSREEPESLPPGIDITPEERAYWAFQPLRRPEIPASTPRNGCATKSTRWSWRVCAKRNWRSIRTPTSGPCSSGRPSI